jgi:pimeloyl-ACP methyl ester carboxylesterase
VGSGERPYVEIGGLRVAYERAGRGPPLILLHGILSDSRAWTRQLAGLADRFTVVAWDAPGAGRSADPPESFRASDYADCLSEFIVALGLDPAHVLGLSWGGVLAQELYRRHPERVRSLMLADTYAGWKGSLSAEECAQRLAGVERMSDGPIADLARSWLPGLLSSDAPAALVTELISIMSESRPASIKITAAVMAHSDQRDLLPLIDVPTLLLWGELDARAPLYVARQFHDAIPGARLAVIPAAGHVSNMEQPERFNAEVRDFCRQVA